MSMMQAIEAVPQAVLNHRLLRIAGEQYGCHLTDLTANQHQQAKQIALKELVLENLILESEEATSVVVPSQSIDSAVQQFQQRYQDEEEFVAALGAADITVDALRESLSRALKVEAVMDLISGSVSEVDDIDDTEANIFYYMYPEKFEQPEKRQAAHILITVNQDYSENTQDQAKQRIDAIAKRVQKNSKRFQEQALKHSECPTAMNQGLLGEVTAGTLYPELEAVLFKLKQGEISAPVLSPLGWHIVYCQKIIAANKMPLAEALPKIKEHLAQRQKKQKQRAWIKQQAEQKTKGVL